MVGVGWGGVVERDGDRRGGGMKIGWGGEGIRGCGWDWDVNGIGMGLERGGGRKKGMQ